MNPREVNISVHARTWVLFLIAKKRKQPSVHQLMSNHSVTATTQYYSAIKGSKALVHAATWTNLESTQRNRSQTHRTVNYVILSTGTEQAHLGMERSGGCQEVGTENGEQLLTARGFLWGMAECSGIGHWLCCKIS